MYGVIDTTLFPFRIVLIISSFSLAERVSFTRGLIEIYTEP